MSIFTLSYMEMWSSDIIKHSNTPFNQSDNSKNKYPRRCIEQKNDTLVTKGQTGQCFPFIRQLKFIYGGSSGSLGASPLTSFVTESGVFYSNSFSPDSVNPWSYSLLEVSNNIVDIRDIQVGAKTVQAGSPTQKEPSQYDLCPLLPKALNVIDPSAPNGVTCCRGLVLNHPGGQSIQTLSEVMRFRWVASLRSQNSALIFKKCYNLLVELHCQFCHPYSYLSTFYTKKIHPQQSVFNKIPGTTDISCNYSILQNALCVDFVDEIYDACRHVPWDSKHWVVPPGLGKNEYRRFMGIPIDEDGNPLKDYPKYSSDRVLTDEGTVISKDEFRCFNGFHALKNKKK